MHPWLKNINNPKGNIKKWVSLLPFTLSPFLFQVKYTFFQSCANYSHLFHHMSFIFFNLFFVYFFFILRWKSLLKELWNFFFLVCAGSLLLCGFSSNFSEQGLASLLWCTRASHCGGFSCCRARALGHSGFSSCGSWTLEHSLNSCDAWV